MSDIKLTQHNELVISNGDLSLCSGNEELLQRIRVRLLSPIHSLFYDENFGSGLLNYIQMEWNESMISLLKNTIISSLKYEPTIEPTSISIIFKQIQKSISLDISFTVFSQPKPTTLHLNI